MAIATSEQSSANKEYVRRLLRQRQPGFSAALELAVDLLGPAAGACPRVRGCRFRAGDGGQTGASCGSRNGSCLWPSQSCSLLPAERSRSAQNHEAGPGVPFPAGSSVDRRQFLVSRRRAPHVDRPL